VQGQSLQTFIGVAHPWMCDVMGHMSARHYMAMFDDASFYLLGTLAGVEIRPGARTGWADVRYEIDYRQEVQPGTLISITSRIERIGRSSVTIVHNMDGGLDRLPRAQATAVTVHFDMTAREAAPLPPDIRARAEALMRR
jgi:acyl-CoA thioester hydrolase